MGPCDESAWSLSRPYLLGALIALGVLFPGPEGGPANATGTTASVRGSASLPSFRRHQLSGPFSGPAASQQALEKGLARPVALAAGDLDGDGVPDLIAGYAVARAGILAVRRGNVDAIYPNSPEARTRRAEDRFTDSPFLEPARLTDVPEAPDFLAVGDFDADDRLDLLIGAADADALYFLQGNGKGELALPERIDLPGSVTCLTAGEIGRSAGLPAVVVALESDAGPRLLVFDSPGGAVRAAPVSYTLPGRATALTLGRFDQDDWVDLAVAAGGDIWMLRGRDRGSPPSGGAALILFLPGPSVAAPSIRSMALEDFDGDGRPDLALLAEDGSLSVGPVPRTLSANGDAGLPRVVRPALPERAGPGFLATAKASGRPEDDLVLLDESARGITVLAGPEGRSERPDGAGGSAGAGDTAIRPWATIDLDGRPVAVLPMRLSGDALSDLVVLQDAPARLTVAAPAPLATLVVTNTNDTGTGSLRQAILDANSTSAADTISFSLSGSGPFIIQPRTALPAIIFPVTIDGTTQPGFAGTPIVQIDGSLAGNGVHGLVVAGGTSTVRGLAVGRFGGTGVGDGLHVQGAGGNVIEGNYLGTDVTGTVAQPNTGSGVVADNVTGNTIGSTVASGRNLLSGNAGSGVVITGSSATTNIVEGNFIGTRAGGTGALGNGSRGVLVDGAPGNTIGISNVLPNVISGNGSEGVVINGSGATGTIVRGNYIGTDASGMSAVRNTLAGLRILSSNASVGGGTVGQRNFIGFNGGNGVTVGSGTGNRLTRNEIFSNSGLGIDLGDDGLTPNDPGDADAGANTLQNDPVLTSAITDSTSSTITGTFNSRPGTAYTIEFFSCPVCDPSGFGEGKQFFISTMVTTDANGNASINLSQPLPLPVRTYLTATATDPGGNTSEFSNCIRVSDQTPQEITGDAWSGATQLSWSAAAGASSYHLYRGQGTFLPNLVNSAMDSCLRLSTTSTTTGTTLTETPAAGSFYWYLVAGVNSFGEGTVGDATVGPRVLDSFGSCPTCAHEKCVIGGPLTSACDPCVASICGANPSCCSTQWTSTCVGQVLGVCGSLQCAASAGACPHQQCITGIALPSGCDSPPVSPSCVSTVCGSDPVCCSTGWDSTCVEEVGTLCAKGCN